MEANTRDRAAVESDLVKERSGLRGRFAGLLHRRGAGVDRAAAGEADLRSDTGIRLDECLAGTSAVVLHDRALPGKSGQVNHLIVSSAGITLVDTRNYASGRARVGRSGLRVGLRDRSELIRRARAQAQAVHNLLASTPYAEVPVDAALAWREVEGQCVLHSFSGPRVLVCGVRQIAREASRPGPLPDRRVTALAAFLERELPTV